MSSTFGLRWNVWKAKRSQWQGKVWPEEASQPAPETRYLWCLWCQLKGFSFIWCLQLFDIQSHYPLSAPVFLVITSVLQLRTICSCCNSVKGTTGRLGPSWSLILFLQGMLLIPGRLEGLCHIKKASSSPAWAAAQDWSCSMVSACE